MKSLSIVGGILLLISGAMFYYSTDFLLEKITMSHMMGVMGGIGIGLIIGGIVGYISKGSAIREEEKRKQFAQLQKQNKELEKKVENINNNGSSNVYRNKKSSGNFMYFLLQGCRKPQALRKPLNYLK